MMPESKAALKRIPEIEPYHERLLWALRQGITDKHVLFEVAVDREWEDEFSPNHLKVMVSTLRKQGVKVKTQSHSPVGPGRPRSRGYELESCQ